MYFEHFNIREMPFTLTPNVQYFCKLPGAHIALNVLLINLRNGEGFIKITGPVGSGKTLLCRLLLDVLDDNFYAAYIPTPDLEPLALRKSIAQELDISEEHFDDPHKLLTAIVKRLMELNGQDKRVVLIIDEAQALPVESLETIRLLTNLETQKSKLLHVILFGQPELNDRLNQNSLRQLKQRIGFSYQLPLLKKDELRTYLNFRLTAAGYKGMDLFTPAARWLLYKESRGVPRLINILCHKAMMAAYGRGEPWISYWSMREAVRDTEAVRGSSILHWLPAVVGAVCAVAGVIGLILWRMQ